MILYLDASALVKRYVMEEGSTAVAEATQEATYVGTAAITRAEAVAALAKAARVGTVTREEAHDAVQQFRSHWPTFIRIQITESLIVRADNLAWQHDLRGYDAVQLAAALSWQDEMDQSIIFATFDRHLWQAAQGNSLSSFPSTYP